MKQWHVWVACLFVLSILIHTNTQSAHAIITKSIHMSDSVEINWLNAFDLDGDGANDNIFFDFSGGAHCCYKIHIALSSDDKVRSFPFEMDGGYLIGVDNSNPSQLDIQDIDNDGRPEILMRIQTYNEKAYPIPLRWKLRYGLKTNNIVFEYENGKIRVMDRQVKEKTIKNN